MKRTAINGMLMIALVASAVSCGPNKRILESSDGNTGGDAAPVSSNAASAVSSFEQDLNAMRTADFKFILVFRRKDGKELEQADKELVANAASQANRRRLSDDGKAVIIGSNFPFAAGAFTGLTERFNMENYSKADSGPMYANSNSNSNSNH